MRKLLLLGAGLLLTVIGAQAQYSWVSQATNFTPVSSGVRYVSAVDTNVLWICSYDGSGGGANRQDYSRTIDGGANWVASTVPAPVSHDWSMIHAINADSAWAVLYNAVLGAKGGVWRTVDGGANWAQLDSGVIYNNASSFPNVVYFWNNMEGFLMGDPNPTNFEIYTSADGGDTWTPVPGANIPAPLSGEYGIVGHFNVMGDTVWFDTNKGRVYRSIDRGTNWTVSSTGITVPANGAIDICFYDHMNGLARLYNSTTGVNTMKVTNDGGDTWTAATPNGNFFGSDVKYIPGTPSRMISTGAATGLVGTSFSDDGGLNWTTLEQTAQRTAVGAVDSLHIWAGGFTTSPSADGIFKLTYIPPVFCSDTLISPGMPSADVDTICGNETVTLTATGVYAPTVGDYFGVSWVISNADITGSSDPLGEPSLIATYTISSPAPGTSIRSLTNDGTLIDGTIVPYGLYYWTPVVFGNATAATAPTFLSDVTLDPNCTYTGASVPVWVLNPNSVACGFVPVTCNDPLVSPGIPSVDNDTICGGQTAVFTSTGVYAPTVGDYSGVSWIISSADITGSADPLGEPSLVATYTFSNPAPSTSTRQITNDGTLIDGSIVPYGEYFWTPVVFANATATGTPQFLGDLTLDPNCTFTGTSVPTWVLDPNGVDCIGVGIPELITSQFNIKAFQKNSGNIALQINAINAGKVTLEIYDVMGRMVSSSSLQVGAGLTNHEINAAKLSAGTYIVRGELNGIRSVSKIVKF